MEIIENLSMTDHLTELPNKRSFELRINTEWVRAYRENTPVSLLVLDLDYLKNLNDNYGRQQGDFALKTVAEIADAAIKRPADFLARWGGEEFIVLLPNTGLDGAFDVAEQIRKRVEEAQIPCSGGQTAKITISIGVNTRKLGQIVSVEEFISGAETALCEAKAAGRNRYSHYNG
jgi:diguanylate cyclase (GGDEF)-like protein